MFPKKLKSIPHSIAYSFSKHKAFFITIAPADWSKLFNAACSDRMAILLLSKP